MNQTALEVFSGFGPGVACIVLGIMALAIFFTVLSRLGNAGARPDAISVRGVLKKDTWAKVYMSDAQTFDVRAKAIRMIVVEPEEEGAG